MINIAMRLKMVHKYPNDGHDAYPVSPQSGLLYYFDSSAVGHAAVAFALIQSKVVVPTAAAPETSVPSVVVVESAKNLKRRVPLVAVGSSN